MTWRQGKAAEEYEKNRHKEESEIKNAVAFLIVCAGMAILVGGPMVLIAWAVQLMGAA